MKVREDSAVRADEESAAGARDFAVLAVRFDQDDGWTRRLGDLARCFFGSWLRRLSVEKKRESEPAESGEESL